MITNALILAGGKGTRLRPITLKTPKPLVKVNQKPLIDYVMDSLLKADMKKIYVAVNYKKGQIKNYLKNRGMCIDTEGSAVDAIIKCAGYIDSPFVCIASDTIQKPETIKDTCSWFEKLNPSSLHHFSNDTIHNEAIVSYVQFESLKKEKNLFRTISIYTSKDLLSIKDKVQKNAGGALLSEVLEKNGFSVKYFLSNQEYLSINTLEELRKAESKITEFLSR